MIEDIKVKKIFFIHIGKTAGSSFNFFLQRYLKGEDHCERYLNAYGFLSEFNYLRSLDYISGHLELNIFNKNGFPRNDYFLVAFLREPISQLISHINWLMSVSDFGPDFFYSLHSDVQRVSHELRAADLYNPDIFISKLEEFKPFFQNYQSKYFRSDLYALSSSFVIERMSELDMVGLTEYYEKSLENFLFLNDLDKDIIVDRENINYQYKVKQDILTNSSIYEFLQDYNSVDIEVYSHFLSAFQKPIVQEYAI